MTLMKRSRIPNISRRALLTGASFIGWLVLVTVAHRWGGALRTSGHELKLHALPLFGEFELRAGPSLVFPVMVAGLVIAGGPVVARRISWRGLLVVAMGAGGAWAISLALVDGPGALTSPLLGEHDYLRALPQVSSLPVFLSTFTDSLADYPIHVQGHPPGPLLFLAGLRAAGLAGSGWAAAVVIGGGLSAIPAAMIAVRSVADEQRARACAPFLVLTPAALWIATSFDALFMGASAWGIALLILSSVRKKRALAQALAGGLVLGGAAMLSYGVVPLGLVVVAVAVMRRNLSVLVAGAAGVALVVAAFAGAGFWWFEGLQATVERYRDGVAATRPYGFFVVNNLAAGALMLGPAVAAGFTRLRGRGLEVVAGSALVALLAADLSGFSKGEVERIWLPFAPWLTAAASSLGPDRERAWLSLQALLALAITVFVRTPW